MFVAMVFLDLSGSGPGNDAMSMRSPDGVTWELSPQTLPDEPGDMGGDDVWFVGVAAWKNGFVAIAPEYDNSPAPTPGSPPIPTLPSYGIYTSPDGMAWSPQILPNTFDGGFACIMYDGPTGGKQFVAGIHNTFMVIGPPIMTSPDGVTWTIQAGSAAVNGAVTIAYGDGVYVALADGFDGQSGNGTSPPVEQIMTSPDGVTWTARASPLNKYGGRALAFGLVAGVPTFCALGISAADGFTSLAVTSTDAGATWTAHPDAAVAAYGDVFPGMGFGGGQFVAVGFDTILTSPDGVTWTSQTSPHPNFWVAPVYSGGKWVVAGDDRNADGKGIMTSPDGVTWTLRTVPRNHVFWRSLCVFANVGNYFDPAGMSQLANTFC